MAERKRNLVIEGEALEASLVFKGESLEARLVTKGAALETSLVNKGITLDASLVTKQSTVDSNTSRLGNENKSSNNESSSSGNDVDADIGPSHNSDTVSEVHHDIFKNMFVHGIQNHEQPESIPDTYVVNENNSDIISEIPNMDLDKESGEKKILFGNETSNFETKIKELEMILAQQTKDFENAKVNFSKKMDKFETYFEKLENERVVLERQLDRKNQDFKSEKDQFLRQIASLESKLASQDLLSIPKEYSDLRTSYNAVKAKFDSFNHDKGKSPVSNFSTPKVSVSQKIYMSESSKSFPKRVSQFTTYSLQKVTNGNPSSVNIKQHCGKIVTKRFTLIVMSALRRAGIKNKQVGPHGTED
ncbi:hypothetical protein Tco_0817108 [Tanacetum coccineum]